MTDYIDRQAAIDALAKHEKSKGHNYTLFVDIVSECAEIIRDLPSAEVEPVKRGRWIIRDNPGTGWYRVTCSECGEDVTSVVPVIGFFPDAKVVWDYCPNCGAKMDEGEAHEQN